MTKKIEKDGSLLLCSDGKKFGDNGFYFTLTNGKGVYWARFVSSMHEWIRVYEDEEDAFQQVNREGQVYEPDPESHEQYNELYRRYERLYPVMKEFYND